MRNKIARKTSTLLRKMLIAISFMSTGRLIDSFCRDIHRARSFNYLSDVFHNEHLEGHPVSFRVFATDWFCW